MQQKRASSEQSLPTQSAEVPGKIADGSPPTRAIDTRSGGNNECTKKRGSHAGMHVRSSETKTKSNAKPARKQSRKKNGKKSNSSSLTSVASSKKRKKITSTESVVTASPTSCHDTIVTVREIRSHSKSSLQHVAISPSDQLLISQHPQQASMPYKLEMVSHFHYLLIIASLT